MSSKPEELCDKGDGFGTFIEELVPEKTVEVLATQVSTMNEVAVAAADSSIPVAAVQYLVDGVHAFTGLNWWASIALTAFLVQGLYIPIIEIRLKSAGAFPILFPRVREMANRKLKDDDFAGLAEYEKQGNALMDTCLALGFRLLTATVLDGFINVCFILEIWNMAEKVPSFKTGGILWFTDLTTPDFYTLPILMGLTMFFTKAFRLEIIQGCKRRNLVPKSLLLVGYVSAWVAVQHALGFGSVMYCFLIPCRLMRTLAISLATIRRKKKSEFAWLSGDGASSLANNVDAVYEMFKVMERVDSVKKQRNDREGKTKQ